MSSLLLKLRAWWETADRTQKVVTIFGGVFLGLLLLGTIYFAGRPKMEPLYMGLSSTDQGMVLNELNKLGVAVELDRQGNILVPANRVADINAQLAVNHKLPTSGRPGYNSLGELGIMNSPKVEQERMKVAIEEELAKSVEQIQGVQAARVHLTLAEESPFERQGKPASASVVITEAPGSPVGPAEAKSIARMVQYAVSGLEEKNITIINSMGQLLVDGASEGSTSGIAERKVTAEINESKRREAELQRKLDIAFGTGNVVVSIPVLEMNFDQKSVQERTPTTSESPISVESNQETMGAGAAGGSNSGAAGTSGNIGAPGSQNGGSGTGSESSRNYNGTSKATNYATGERQTTTTPATGNITAMSINVLVNSTAIKDPAPVEKYVQQYLGPKLADTEHFSSSVTSVAFDETAKKTAAKADQDAAGAARMQQIFSLLPIVALIVVGFMVIKAIGKTAKAGNVTVAALPGGGVMPMGGRAMPQVQGLPPGGIQHQDWDYREIPVEELPPGLDPNQIYVMGPDGEPIPASQKPGLAFIETGPNVGAIATISEKVNIPLEQIKKMAVDKPQAVAMLIKSWLLDDRK